MTKGRIELSGAPCRALARCRDQACSEMLSLRGVLGPPWGAVMRASAFELILDFTVTALIGFALTAPLGGSTSAFVWLDPCKCGGGHL